MKDHNGNKKLQYFCFGWGVGGAGGSLYLNDNCEYTCNRGADNVYKDFTDKNQTRNNMA